MLDFKGESDRKGERLTVKGERLTVKGERLTVKGVIAIKLVIYCKSVTF